MVQYIVSMTEEIEHRWCQMWRQISVLKNCGEGGKILQDIEFIHELAMLDLECGMHRGELEPKPIFFRSKIHCDEKGHLC